MEIYKPESVSLTPIERPDEFIPIVEILERPATASFLRECDLLKKMRSNDIGTDSTRHIHIKKLIDIGYVTKDDNSQFQPTELGDTLVKAYTDVGLGELFNPKLHQSMVNASKSALKLMLKHMKNFLQVAMQNKDRFIKCFEILFDRRGQACAEIFLLPGIEYGSYKNKEWKVQHWLRIVHKS
ncbi:putative DNA topoisomerase [Helianthus annuus]|uniref:DNA topoisomerase n=1 Tax=Helianthus annuus TaxID=4232 RepID=A0A251VET8_HELAN|nr:putative DNA topoisomerase [Helianthus annuus]KAJ0603853.1 putative DNA topoisomerase [Helianthus annuus]KAJ0614144.1 putative DNA topoisomerase [Helianthus annuus]KAJ0617761.1 putative DNA topoisomerase [Helianthus annuus]KAJ0776301.1 putative DNA topoisomerase [Helianthus annuus]